MQLWEDWLDEDPYDDAYSIAFFARSVEIEQFLPEKVPVDQCAARTVCVLKVLLYLGRFWTWEAYQLKFSKKLVQHACEIERLQSQYELLTSMLEKAQEDAWDEHRAANGRTYQHKTELEKSLEKKLLRFVNDCSHKSESELNQLFSEQLSDDEEDESAGVGVGVQVCVYGW